MKDNRDLVKNAIHESIILYSSGIAWLSIFFYELPSTNGTFDMMNITKVASSNGIISTVELPAAKSVRLVLAVSYYSVSPCSLHLIQRHIRLLPVK